ncbi:hypothetical protein DFJ74DRAFT_424325 [Hyaloraphidium curvatum]|nr:hypothetical protein DFJ74DRAFT_424325 [Hyaloraphidium curvatum]
MFSHAIALLLVLTTALTAGPRPASAQTQFAIINQPPVCKDIHGLFAWTSTPPSGDPWPGPDAGGFATVGAGTSRFWPCRLTNAPGGTPLPGYSSSLEPIKFCNIGVCPLPSAGVMTPIVPASGYNGIEMAGDPPSSQWLTKLGPGLSATLNWVSLGNVGADPPEQFRFPRGSFVSGGTVPAYPGSDRVICAARGSEHLGPGHSSNFFIGYSQLPYPGYPDDNGACWIGVGGSQKKFVTDVHFLMVTKLVCHRG